MKYKQESRCSCQSRNPNQYMGHSNMQSKVFVSLQVYSKYRTVAQEEGLFDGRTFGLLHFGHRNLIEHEKFWNVEPGYFETKLLVRQWQVVKHCLALAQYFTRQSFSFHPFNPPHKLTNDIPNFHRLKPPPNFSSASKSIMSQPQSFFKVALKRASFINCLRSSSRP
jgi:hypothetical protein